MNNKNSNLLTSKNANLNFKDLFEKKLKDRNKIKGYCFSYNSRSPIFNHTYIQNILYNTYYDISKKLMKEGIFRNAIGNYEELKKDISSFEHNYKTESEDEKKKKNQNFNHEKLNFTNLSEIFKEFLRDKKKHNINKNSIIKSKLKLDNINRNIRKNRISSALAKVSLNSKKIKTKVDMGQNRSENNENIYKDLIGIINQSRKKWEQKKNKNKKRNIVLNRNNIANIDKMQNKPYIIKTNSNNENISTYNNSYFNNIENAEIQKQKYINNFQKDKNNKNINLKKRPLSFSRNRTQFNYIDNNISSSNTKMNNKRSTRSAIRRKSPKIKNKPLYTSKIEDLLNEYNRIKKQNKLAKNKFRKTHYLTYNEIDKIMKVKEDLLLFQLKQKFLKKQFPKPFIKKQNKKELFIKKFKNDLDFIDKKNSNYYFQ